MEHGGAAEPAKPSEPADTELQSKPRKSKRKRSRRSPTPHTVQEVDAMEQARLSGSPFWAAVLLRGCTGPNPPHELPHPPKIFQSFFARS
eukprot:7408961-Alexandrium_andersonii.AAC.1